MPLKRVCDGCGSIDRFDARFCQGCGLHPHRKASDERAWQRYLQLKRQWIKDNGIPLNDNFDGALPFCDKGGGTECPPEKHCPRCLLRKAEMELPAVAATQIRKELSGEFKAGGWPFKDDEAEEADAVEKRKGTHYVCQVCGKHEVERKGR